MTDDEEFFTSLGLAPDDVTSAVDYMIGRQTAVARAEAVRVLHVIFLRVEQDSAAGCALRRALGFSNDVSLRRAAAAFSVTKQYLHDLQKDLEAALGPLSFNGPDRRRGAREQSGPTTAAEGEKMQCA